MAIKTGKQLAEAAIDAAQNHKTLYVMGCFGAPLTGANVDRYCRNHAYNNQVHRTAMIKAKANQDPPVFGFDCVCLIKGLLWGWDGSAKETYGGAVYKSNGVPDTHADAMYNLCTEKSEDFSLDAIQVGEAVWKRGHIGIYIGDGKAVECTPDWANGVQITSCNRSITGLHRRNWSGHGKLPFIEYPVENSVETVEKPETEQQNTVAPKIGDIVNFTGTTHYSNTNAPNGVPCKPGRAVVTRIVAGGKHPYHLVKVNSGESTVYGWVDVADIQGAEQAPEAAAPEQAPQEPWKPSVGETVYFTGNAHYSNANAAQGVTCKPGKAKITRIAEGKKHPYHLVKVYGGGSTVYGWVDAGTFKKA